MGNNFVKHTTTRIILNSVQIPKLATTDVLQMSRREEDNSINQVTCYNFFYTASSRRVDDPALQHGKIIIGNDFKLFPNHSQRGNNNHCNTYLNTADGHGTGRNRLFALSRGFVRALFLITEDCGTR